MAFGMVTEKEGPMDSRNSRGCMGKLCPGYTRSYQHSHDMKDRVIGNRLFKNVIGILTAIG